MGRRDDRSDPHTVPQKPLGLFHPLRFKSGTSKIRFAVFLYARIAQLAEQLICNQQVVGSNPTAGSIVAVISVARPGTGIRISGVFLVNPCP